MCTCARVSNRKVLGVRSHNKKASSSWTVWVLISNRAVKGRVNNLTVPVKLLVLGKYTFRDSLSLPRKNQVFLLILYIVFNRLNEPKLNGRELVGKKEQFRRNVCAAWNVGEIMVYGDSTWTSSAVLRSWVIGKERERARIQAYANFSWCRVRSTFSCHTSRVQGSTRGAKLHTSTQVQIPPTEKNDRIIIWQEELDGRWRKIVGLNAFVFLLV